MKRQIIKTRPVRPYRIARVVILIILVALLAAAAFVWLAPHGRPAHVALAGGTCARQDLTNFARNSRTPAILS